LLDGLAVIGNGRCPCTASGQVVPLATALLQPTNCVKSPVKLIGPQLFNEFPTFYGIRKIIAIKT
jgi:hypothetical protein